MLNLLPWREIKRRKMQQFFYGVIVLSVVATSLTFIVLRIVVEQRILALSAVIQKIKVEQSKEVSQKKGLRNDLLKNIAETNISIIFQSQQNMINIISLICSLLPNNSCLTSLMWQKQTLFMEGILLSTSQDVINNFILLLNRRYHIKVKNTSIKFMQVQKIAFKLLIDPSLRRNDEISG